MNQARSTLTTPAMVVDWPTIITDMQWLLGEDVPGSQGVTMREPIGTRAMAVQLGVSRDLVRNWLNGTRVEHSHGEMLIARWCSLTGKVRAFLPMTRRVFSASKA